MGIFANLDLLTVGAVVAATSALGFSVYFSKRTSITNQTFLWFSITTAIWGIVNYAVYQTTDTDLVLWGLRLILFFAVWQAFFILRLFMVFPEAEKRFGPLYRFVTVPAAWIASLLTLTPFVFSRIVTATGVGTVSDPDRGPAIAVFGIVAVGFVLASIFLLIRKIRSTSGPVRSASVTLLIGVTITFALIIVFNFLVPMITHDRSFIPLGALFTFPFILAASYAILRQRLFNVKVAATSVLVFLLSITSFAEIVFSNTAPLILFRTGVFLLVLIFGVNLIRGVLREVEQREHIEALAKDLEEANVKLKELDRLKSQFLSIASHDLRAPLTIVRNFISLLLEGTYGKLSAAGEEGLRQVFDRATDMAKSVETYLNVSRIEQGRMKYDFIEIELLPLVKNAVTAFAPNAEKKGLKFNVSYDQALEGVKAKIDVAKMNEVLNNLLDNTIKYTPTGSIDVSVKRMGQIARIAIKDTGVGMSQETIGKLFQLFSTADNSRKVNTTSTGVGLYISKAHVVAHGGKVWAESEGEGKGSTFIVELPLLP